MICSQSSTQSPSLSGPFTPASRGRKFLIVGIDYFTKWIEAEPTAKITAIQICFWFF
ncbi:hypothetical protein BVRB_011400 [Beta vulgaris subsp. vulgaris]|uniref:Uncharacterized protein n=1 Tax=Beta vulgaris subsp. vulgaris TaxID=3555 RepID=A0A0J8DWG5_BETVV|nr:hypothetical protein BVRB_011400 [Beta vulgaris subsp. vulgaris]